MSAHKQPRGLGKGFDALIPQDFDSSLLVDASERVQKLFVNKLKPSQHQPRKNFDQESLEQLASSIKRHGLLQPLIVTPAKNDTYDIVAGERRWRAAQIAGLTSVPAIVRSTKELEHLEIALIENVQRVDLSPLEQAVSIQRLHDQFNMEYQEIAQRLGKAVTTISNIVRLLQLPSNALEALRQEKITEGHARTILALKGNTDSQNKLLDQIIQNGWSVRQAERFVLLAKQGTKPKQRTKAGHVGETPATQRLSRILKAPVTLRRTKRGVILEIKFSSEENLRRLLTLLDKD